MAKRKEDHFFPVADQKRARPGTEDSDEEMPGPTPQCLCHGHASAQPDSEEVGIIESIQLQNFMGYAMLGPVRFGPKINFVVGYSGKNALLTALIVGLGGKSLGTSLREFVKDGEESANILITLKNRGDEAFKYELYGDTITVHQHISVDGSASFELRNHLGNVVSCRREDLTAILEYFKIQVDNSISVLPQTLGRLLLSIRNESDKYKLFMEATDLEHMRDGLSKILARKASSQQEIEQGRVKLEELKQQGILMEEHFKTMLSLEQRLASLKREKTWALVKETEKTVSNMMSDINVENQHTVLLNHDLEVSRVTYNATLQRYIAIHENVLKLNEEAAALEPKYIEAKEIARRIDRDYRQATAFYNYSQNELIKLDRVSEQLRDKIVDLRKTLELAEIEKQKQISALKEKISNFKKLEESVVQEIKHLHQSIEKDDEEHSRIREEETFVREILKVEKEKLDHLKDNQANPIKRFGPQIIALIQAIEDACKEGYFAHKPLGPLGICIRLRNPEYALAVETCLKGLLLDFICDNQKDEQVLQELIKRIYPNPSPDEPQIVVSSFQCELYDVTDRAASHPEYPTVLEALEIDEAVVANTLIDRKNIESVLLIKSDSLTDIFGQGRPKNCNKILSACGNQIFEGNFYTEEAKPLYLSDLGEEINILEKEVENKMIKLSEFQEHVYSLQNGISRNQETVDSHYQHLREIKIKIITLSSEIKDLEDQEENRSIDLSVLEDEAEEIKEEIKEVEEKMKIRKEKMENLMQPKLDAEQRHEEFKLKCNQVSNLVESLMEERNQTGLEVTAQHQSVLHYQNRLKDHIDSLQVIKDDLAVKEKALERERAHASYICPDRIEVTRPSDSLDREINLLTVRIKSENYTHRSREDITRHYQESKDEYMDLSGRVSNLKTLIETLDEILIQRYDTYQKSRKNLSLQCKLFFDSLLSHWSLCGEMRFNHKTETLCTMVQPREVPFADMVALTANSQIFSNFLFILTLWSVTEAPFRCLDTVDIYMDRESRKIAMEMIVWLSHYYQNHQVILLSPQFMDFLPQSPLVHILQIPELEGDGNTLPF